MSSLKNTQLDPAAGPKKALSDFPAEILDLILDLLYYSSDDHRSTIVPMSLTCRKIRLLVCPRLFGKLIIKANEDIIDRFGWKCLHCLASRPGLLSYVRCLEIQTGVVVRELPIEADINSARMGRVLSRKRLKECLDLMYSLRSLKLHYISDMTLDVLEQLTPLDPLQVSLDLTQSELSLSESHCTRLIRILNRSPGWVVSLSLPPSRQLPQPDDLAELLASGRIESIDWCDNSSALDALVARNHRFRELEELHISSKILGMQYSLLTPGFIPWPMLKRLHVQGDRQVKYFLSSIVDKLYHLEDLCLHASTTDAFHDNCVNIGYTIPQRPLAFTRLPNLRHLSLHGVCPHLHVSHLTTSTLRSLILVIPECHARRRSLNEVRPPAEIEWLATNLPHLEHLELHVGSLDNLWHPTATPGAEVNVEVNAALEAIAQIPNLRTLRLFPPFIPREMSNRRRLIARQSMPDEQAIRVFRYLHAQNPGLQTLSISATFCILGEFTPMSWLVRDAGPHKIILITHQSQRPHELEQTWTGEERSSPFDRRHTFYHPYLTVLRAGWTFPVVDLPAL